MKIIGCFKNNISCSFHKDENSNQSLKGTNRFLNDVRTDQLFPILPLENETLLTSILKCSHVLNSYKEEEWEGSTWSLFSCTRNAVLKLFVYKLISQFTQPCKSRNTGILAIFEKNGVLTWFRLMYWDICSTYVVLSLYTGETE